MLDGIFCLVCLVCLVWRGIAGRRLLRNVLPAKTVYGIFRAGRPRGVCAASTTRCAIGPGFGRAASHADRGSNRLRLAPRRGHSPAHSRGYDAGKGVNGKRHLAVDTGGLLLAVVVTIAGIQDRDGSHQLPTALRPRFATIRTVWADGGYVGHLVTWRSRCCPCPS